MRAVLFASAAISIAALTGASCVEKPPPPPREPPARVLATTFDRVSLRANAYVELHAWLALSARSDGPVPPELENAKAALARVIKEDDHDAHLARVALALASCTDDRCAARVATTMYGHAWEEALPAFTQRAWAQRAGASHAAIDATQAALGIETEPIMARIADDLAVTFPEQPVPIDVVSEAPAAGNEALLPLALGARGSCFLRQAKEDLKVHHARILDCVLVRAFLALSAQSRLYGALARELRGEELERAWTLVVIHAVAMTVTGWEPHHASPTRRSANAVPRARPVLVWLTENWGARANRSEGIEAFAARYLAANKKESGEGDQR